MDSRPERISLLKVVKLLTDPHSAKLYDRHIIALRKVVKHYSDGFLMKDIVLVFRILNVCADNIESVPAYEEPMSALLQLCRLPYLKEKTSDETAYEQMAIECTEQLGYLIRVPSCKLRQQICETLAAFYTQCKKLPVSTEKYKPNSLTYNQKIVNKSNIAETLTQSLAIVDNDFEVKIAVLDLLQKLTHDSEENCNRMLNANGAHWLCSRLMDHDLSRQLLFRSIEILWNVLENCTNREQLGLQLNDVLCVSQLRDAFVYLMTQSFSHFDRQLRNDLLVIISLISATSVEIPYVQSGLAKHLILFTTFQEVKSHNVLVKHLKLTPNHEDFELKKLLINQLVLLSRDPAVLPIYSEMRVLLALFSYVKANEMVGSPLTVVPSRDWTAAQYEEIQLLAMSALCTLAPLMIDDYIECHGGTRLLLMLEWCVINDDYTGFGNGFHATGGCGSKRAHMRQCLRLIRSIVSTHDDTVITNITEQGAIHQLACVLEQFQKGHLRRKDYKMDDAVDIEMQCDLLVILSIICQFDVHRKDLFGSKGADILTTYLRMDLRLMTSGLGHHRLLLCAIQCAWCTVVGSYVMEDQFLEKEGIFFLLDLLESCPHMMHNELLGCLLDLMENPKTMSHVSVWRGKDNMTAAHLLCQLWRDEERRLDVQRDAAGAVTDSQKPLAGLIQDAQSIVSLPASCPSPAIVDVSENSRSKLYAIFSKMGFVELPGLTTEDHVTLMIIEHYLDLKAGEVWTEVMSELQVENVRPVTPDREALEAILTAVSIRAEQVKQVQHELLEAQKQQDLMEEQEFYAQIRENHRQKEKEMKNFAELVSRTSKHSMLKAAKSRQTMSIDASRIYNHNKAKAVFHSTGVQNLNVTAFCQRYIEIENTLAHYDPSTGTSKRTGSSLH